MCNIYIYIYIYMIYIYIYIFVYVWMEISIDQISCIPHVYPLVQRRKHVHRRCSHGSTPAHEVTIWKHGLGSAGQRRKSEIQRDTGWWFQPLWKIWKSISMTIPNVWKNKTCSKHFQTTNQDISRLLEIRNIHRIWMDMNGKLENIRNTNESRLIRNINGIC